MHKINIDVVRTMLQTFQRSLVVFLLMLFLFIIINSVYLLVNSYNRFAQLMIVHGTLFRLPKIALFFCCMHL